LNFRPADLRNSAIARSDAASHLRVVPKIHRHLSPQQRIGQVTQRSANRNTLQPIPQPTIEVTCTYFEGLTQPSVTCKLLKVQDSQRLKRLAAAVRFRPWPPYSSSTYSRMHSPPACSLVLTRYFTAPCLSQAGSRRVSATHERAADDVQRDRGSAVMHERLRRYCRRATR
jgi:hypothetical protein